MILVAGHSIKPMAPDLQVDSTFATSLIGAWIAMDGYSKGYRDYSHSKNHASWVGSYQPSPVSSPYGPAWPCDGNAGGSHFATTPSLTLNPTAGTCLLVFKSPPFSTGYYLFSNTGAGSQLIDMQVQTNNRFRFDIGNGTTGLNATGAVFTSGFSDSWHTAAGRYGPDGLTLWVDGIVQATNATAGVMSQPSSDFLTIGGRTLNACTGAIDSLFIYGRGLTDSEIRQWSADPWQGFRPSLARSFSFSSSPSYSGSGSPSLSALSASATASYTNPNYSATGTPSLSSLSSSASASYTAPNTSGSGTVTLANLSASAVASYDAPGAIDGFGTPSLSALTVSGSGSFTAPANSGSGVPALSSLTATASASYTAPVIEDIFGSGSPSLGNLSLSSFAFYVGPPEPVVLYRDRDAYNGILALLSATGEFDRVIFAHSANRDNLAAQERVVAVVSPLRFTEANDGDPRRKYRSVEYMLTVKLMADDTDSAYQVADRLNAVIHDALESVSFGGFTIPWKSVVGSGVVNDSRRPEYRLTTRCQFAYVTELVTGYSTSA